MKPYLPKETISKIREQKVRPTLSTKTKKIIKWWV